MSDLFVGIIKDGKILGVGDTPKGALEDANRRWAPSFSHDEIADVDVEDPLGERRPRYTAISEGLAKAFREGVEPKLKIGYGFLGLRDSPSLGHKADPKQRANWDIAFENGRWVWKRDGKEIDVP